MGVGGGLLASAVALGTALVAGAVGAVLVVGGIVLAEALRRRAERRDKVRDACRLLALRLPVVLSHLFDARSEVGRLGVDSPAWHHLQEVNGAIFEIDTLTRGRRGRWGRVNALAADMSARLLAAQLHTSRGVALIEAQRFDFNIGALYEAVFGPRPSDDERFQHYLAVGPAGPAYETADKRRGRGRAAEVQS